MKEHRIIEVISPEMASKIASKDAQSQSTSKDYAKDNSLTYYLLINTWVLLWKNFARHAWHRLLARIIADGLIPVIKEMQEEAMRVLTDSDFGPWARILFSEVQQGNPVVDEDLFDTTIGRDDAATVLFLLRYPKRFSPNDNDVIQEETLQDFLAYENRTKLLQRSESYGRWMATRRVADVIRRMYPWDKIIQEIDSLEPDDIIFSAGSAIDAPPSIGGKVKAIVEDGNHADYIRPIFGVYTLARYAAHDENRDRISKIVAVPKSYKSSRIIAMERTYPNALGKAIENIFRKYDKQYHTGINLEDQSINQDFAQEGSYYGTVATIDATHASDLISKTSFKDAFPVEYVKRVDKLLPTHCLVNGQKRMLQMASTSGNTLTFRHETIFYRAIVQAAVEITQELGIPIKHIVHHAYGDDSEVSVEAYEIALYLFDRLGLVINEDKSYASGSYRESCGRDFIDGVDVTSIYYPRFPIIGTITGDKVTLSNKVFNDEYRGKLDNALTMLVDLQKKLLPYSDDCARLILSVVQTAYPSLTTSLPGEVCNDLWDYMESGKFHTPIAYRLERSGEYKTPDRLWWEPIGPASDGLSYSNRCEFDRLVSLDRVHVYPSEAYTKESTEFSSSDVAVYEYWKYQSFLRSGPQYDDELSKLLGISKRPISISEFFGKRTLALKKTK